MNRNYRAFGPSLAYLAALGLTYSIPCLAQSSPPSDASPSEPSSPPNAGPPNAGPPNAEPPSTAEPEGLVPPALLDSPLVPYPESELANPVPVCALVRVELDATGQVRSAELVEEIRAPFAEIALTAAKNLHFSPALRDGTAIPARIVVELEFRPPEKAEGPPPSPSPEALTPTSETSSALEPIDVQVQGALTRVERIERSADAVTIVRLDKAKERSSDMGEVLARTPGVVIRRNGGLGSEVRISLNGLYDRAVRQFIDGVPLWMSGFSENVGAISVNLIDHVEIYRGVVPLRLGADALGGAINFALDRTYETRAGFSYQIGSFDTHRLTATGQYRQEKTNFVARINAYLDTTKNDYNVDVQVSDDQGQLSPATVRLFHNAFLNYGVIAEAGYVEKPWAKRFLVRGYMNGSYKEYQHNLVMSVPYGEPYYDDISTGAQVVYDQAFSKTVNFESSLVYGFKNYHFVDKGEWVYNWYGERIRERRRPGEIADPTDATIWRHALFARTFLEWRPVPTQALVVTATPLLSTQTGDEKIQTDPDARDPLTARNDTLGVVGGIGHEWNVLAMPRKRGAAANTVKSADDFRVQNLLNGKIYGWALSAEEPLPGDVFRTRDKSSLTFGIGDGMRVSLSREFMLKASYEYATRLPDPFEVFGDEALVQSNLDLVPEVSHNANFGPLFDAKKTSTGDWVAMLNGTFRDSDHMMVLLGNDRYFTYQNVYRAVGFGVEAGVSWTSPLEFVSLDWSGTFNDTRNQSDDGAFKSFKGDRIPNRSPLGTSWAIRGKFKKLFSKRDRLEPFYEGRFTAGYYRGWESQGDPRYKQQVGDQVSQNLGLTYFWSDEHIKISNTLEIQNITNEKLFDDYGVQRPGRAVFFKVVANAF